MELKTKKLPTAGLLALQNRKLLLAFSKNKKAWYLPGGKIDNDETSEQALIREIQEELNVPLLPEKLQFYYHISAPAYGEYPVVQMEQDCFLYPLQEAIHPNNEIAAVRYFSLEEYQQEAVQVEGVIIAFRKLITDGYL